MNLNKNLVIAGDRDIGLALAHVLRRKRPGQMLILLSREREAELLSEYVKLGESVSILHGHTSPKDRARVVEAWRTGQLQTLIGTRNASLLPAHSLTTVLVLDSGNEEHINERRNPRFDAREAVKLLAQQHSAHVVYFDALPRLEEAVLAPLVTTSSKAPDEIVINLGSSDELTAEPMLSDSVIYGIEKALQSQKKVLLFLNRKGVAKRLQCGKCGHIPVCGTCGHVPIVRHDDLVCLNCQTEMWIPAQCPACGKSKLTLRGIGGTKIVTTLQTLFPGASLGKIEKGDVDNPTADIVVATEYFFSSYLEPFTAKRFGLVADLAADIALHASDFRGAEETARKLHRLINLAERQGAEVLVQTWLPDVLRPMLDVRKFVETELEIRKSYQLPPYSRRVVLHGTKLDDLPQDLRELALERDETLEITQTSLPHHAEARRNTRVALKQLPDSIKIQYDGAYVKGLESDS
jgi:primosomal protein N' (replication factor Y)